MNIVIVGAGHGGYEIINSLTNLDDVKISMIVDKNCDAPGMKLAQNLNIKCGNDIQNISTENVDIIIEVTGSQKLQTILREKYGTSCTIIDSNAALLLMKLVKKDSESVNKMNAQISDIKETSGVIENAMTEIYKSVNTIHEVSSELLESTLLSKQYIDESTKIIKYFNDISKQTKILGINASIESARAGESGKGFSVVAKEVQKLANNSADSSKEINSILSKLTEVIMNISDQVNNLDEQSDTQIIASDKVSTAVNNLVSNAYK